MMLARPFLRVHCSHAVGGQQAKNDTYVFKAPEPATHDNLLHMGMQQAHLGSLHASVTRSRSEQLKVRALVFSGHFLALCTRSVSTHAHSRVGISDYTVVALRRRWAWPLLLWATADAIAGLALWLLRSSAGSASQIWCAVYLDARGCAFVGRASDLMRCEPTLNLHPCKTTSLAGVHRFHHRRKQRGHRNQAKRERGWAAVPRPRGRQRRDGE